MLDDTNMIKIEDVKQAYLKLKRDLYFSNNIYYKNMIANFELMDNNQISIGNGKILKKNK